MARLRERQASARRGGRRPRMDPSPRTVDRWPGTILSFGRKDGCACVCACFSTCRSKTWFKPNLSHRVLL